MLHGSPQRMAHQLVVSGRRSDRHLERQEGEGGPSPCGLRLGAVAWLLYDAPSTRSDGRSPRTWPAGTG